MGDEDKKSPTIKGTTGGSTTVVLGPTPPASVSVTIEKMDAPEPERFVPLAPGKDKVTVHYSLEPKKSRFDKLTITIVDATGAVVFERVYTKKDKTAEAAARAQDAGSGCDFVWDGRESVPGKGYKGLHPHVHVKGSPFEIRIKAELAGVAGESAGQKVSATPLVDKAIVVSRVNKGAWDDTNKLVANADQVDVLGLIRAQMREPADREWFAVAPAEAGSAKAGKEKITFAVWDEAKHGALEVRWQTITPRKNGRGIMGHKDVNRQNSERKTTEGEYTNVVSNGPEEGKWIGLDTIEYEHEDAGTGSSPNPDTEDGTVRWHFDVDYALDGIKLGAKAPGSAGRHDATPPSAKFPVKSGVASGDYVSWGIANTVHRTSRRGSNANLYLSYIEAYKRVPWVYGSIDPQVLNFVGFDCADVCFGAAIFAGVTQQRAFTNANNLCRVAKYTTRRAKLPIMYFDDSGKIFSIQDDKELTVAAGTTPDVVNVGDVMFFDWDGEVNEKGAGKWKHTTVVWAAPSGKIDLDTELVMAHHNGFHVETIRELVNPPRKQTRWTVCFWT